jgi:hypothetical protein
MDVADAFVAYARFHPMSWVYPALTRCRRVRALARLGPSTQAHGTIWETLDTMEETAREHYFTLVQKLEGSLVRNQLQQNFERIYKKDGVTIKVENLEDDPFMVQFIIHDEVADAWAEVHGSLCGGTWEKVDGPDFVYDIGTWHPKLFEELKKEGFDLDFSEYSEPEAGDFPIAEHAGKCDRCSGDFSKAKKHLAEVA